MDRIQKLPFVKMFDSEEYRTVVACAKQLEIALKSDRGIVYFLHQEGFITQEVHDDVLNPSSVLTDPQKAGKLVTAIRDKVNLYTQNYQIFMNHLRKSKRYGNIVKILDMEYSKQKSTIIYGEL